MSVIKTEYQTPLIGAYLVLVKNNQILLSRRNDTQYKGVYSLVCGHVEKGEDIIDAMLREAKEEIGITLDRTDTKVIAAVHRPAANYKNEIIDIIDFFVLAHEYSGEINNLEPDKTQEVVFCEIEKIPTNCTRQVKKALELFKTSEFYGVIKS